MASDHQLIVIRESLDVYRATAALLSVAGQAMCSCFGYEAMSDALKDAWRALDDMTKRFGPFSHHNNSNNNKNRNNNNNKKTNNSAKQRTPTTWLAVGQFQVLLLLPGKARRRPQ